MPAFISPCQDSKYFGKEIHEKLEEYLRFHYKSLGVVDLMEEYKKIKGFDDVQAFKENELLICYEMSDMLYLAMTPIRIDTTSAD